MLTVKALFDTTVLVAALVERHPAHQQSFGWLKKAESKAVEGFVATHSLAELYAALTTLPVRPRISTLSARRLIRENVEKILKVRTVTSADYRRVLDDLSQLELTGDRVDDGLTARMAEKLKVGKLLTLNTDDLLRVWPEGKGVVQEP